MSTNMTNVTRILAAVGKGDAEATDELLVAVYQELRKLAAARLSQEPAGQTLQATALVHEAYVRLVHVESARSWDSCGHFFAAAAEAMRRILVDAARTKRTQRRGGDGRKRELLEGDAVDLPIGDDLLDLNDALDRLAQENEMKAELVKLRFFGGLTLNQAAATLGISPATADRYWAYARAWLYDDLASSETSEAP